MAWHSLIPKPSLAPVFDPSFLHTASDQKLEPGKPGNEASVAPFLLVLLTQ